MPTSWKGMPHFVNGMPHFMKGMPHFMNGMPFFLYNAQYYWNGTQPHLIQPLHSTFSRAKAGLHERLS